MGDLSFVVVVMKADGLALKSLLKRKPNTFVKISWHTESSGQKKHAHCTQIAKGSTEPLWEEAFQFTDQEEDWPIVFEILDTGFGSSHSYGTVTKTVKELFAFEEDRPEILFPSCGATLSIRIDKQAHLSPGDVLQTARHSSEHFYQIPGRHTTIPPAYSSLGEVMQSLGKLMELADSVARVHPYVNLAWKTVTAVFRIVQKQLDRDQAICGLLQTMATLYNFVTPLESMRRSHQEFESSLLDVVKQILQQTVECSLFVQEYSGSGFAGRSIKHTFSATEAKIKAFENAFMDLGSSLDIGLGVQSALVTIRMAGDIERLALSNALKPATMDWSGRPTCHPKTRLDAMRTISTWITDPSSGERVLWITGVAGTGKSTLATTLANLYAETQRLGAFVFFDRDVDERNDPNNVLRTLAFELSKYDSRIAERVTNASRQYSRIAQMQLDAQFKNLIQIPLLAAVADSPDRDSLADEGPIVIVIDSLDECGNSSTRVKLLELLAKETASLPPIFRFIITSRNEPDIHMKFSKPTHVRHYELESSDDHDDIRTYLETQLADIAERNYLDDGWPGNQQLDALARRAGGLFIWASTAVKYIEEYDPETAIEELLSGEGLQDGLDELYSKALRSAGIWNKDQFQKDFQAIFGLVMVAKNPMAPNTIDTFLNIQGKSLRLLTRFGSVLHQNGPDHPVRILHKSFSEYIASSERCNLFNPDPKKYKDAPWFIDTAWHEHQAATTCLKSLEKTLKTPRLFVISEGVKANYTDAIVYACSHWIQHAIAVKEGERGRMASTVYAFMKLYIMRWFEAMSVLELSRSTPSLLEQLHSWASDTGNEDLTTLAYDAYRFSSFFAETLAEHPAMVMQVALPFTPVESKLYKLFHNSDEYPTVMGGYLKHWSPSLRVFPILDTSVISAVFSPDMTKVVSTGAYFGDDALINGDENNCVRCWDVATGTEAMPRVELEFTSLARFSPDGTAVWVASGLGTVSVLAASTGDVVSVFRMRTWMGEDNDDASRPASRVSTRCSSVARHRSRSPKPTMRHTASLDSAVEPSADPPPPYDADTSPDSHRPSSMPSDGSEQDDDDEFVTDINFTRAAFSENGRWVIFGDDSGLLHVVDRNAQRRLYPPLECAELQWRDVVRMFTSIVFSPDDSYFAVGAGNGTVHIWDTESGDKLADLEGHAREITALAFSEDGGMLYSASEDGHVRTWDPATHDCLNSITIDCENIPKYQPIAFSPQGRLASTSADGTIQIWDVQTGEEVGPVLQGHFNAVSAMTFSKDGTKLVSGAFKNNIQTWDVRGSGEADLVRIPRHERPPHNVEFSPSGLIVRSSRPNETKFWSSITGRELKMKKYNKSANFVRSSGGDKEEEDEDGDKDEDEDEDDDDDDDDAGTAVADSNVFELDDADKLVTSSGAPVVLLDDSPEDTQSTDYSQWVDAMKTSDSTSLHWTWPKSDSKIRYHHPSTISEDDGSYEYETDGLVIWCLPEEFRLRSKHLRPNFCTIGIWNGRVIVLHIPPKLIERNISVKN